MIMPSVDVQKVRNFSMLFFSSSGKIGNAGKEWYSSVFVALRNSPQLIVFFSIDSNLLMCWIEFLVTEIKSKIKICFLHDLKHLQKYVKKTAYLYQNIYFYWQKLFLLCFLPNLCIFSNSFLIWSTQSLLMVAISFPISVSFRSSWARVLLFSVLIAGSVVVLIMLIADSVVVLIAGSVVVLVVLIAGSVVVLIALIADSVVVLVVLNADPVVVLIALLIVGSNCRLISKSVTMN